MATETKRFMPFIGIFVLCAAIITILFSGTTGINAGNIQQHLQHFADYVAKEADANGKIGKFTYGAPEVEGWGFNKHASVGNVSLELAEKSAPDNAQWVFSTSQMLVAADPASTQGLTFIFPGPIDVAENGQPKTTITFPSRLKYVYFEDSRNHTIAHTLYLPNELTLTTPGSDAGKTVISYDKNPLFGETINVEKNQREATYEFHNVILAAADSTQVTAAGISSHFEQAPKDNHLEGTYTLAVSDLVVHGHDKVSNAYSLTVDLASSRDMPTMTPDAPTIIYTTKTTINNLLLSTDNFKVKVTGDVSSTSDDALPFGISTVDIDNVPQFLASELIPDNMRKMFTDALLKITGQAPDTLTNATFTVKRDKGGTLYVGNTTFETLVASVLADMVQAAAPTAAAPAPAAAPVVPTAPTIPPANDNTPAPNAGQENPAKP